MLQHYLITAYRKTAIIVAQAVLCLLPTTIVSAQSWSEFEGEFGQNEGLVTKAEQLSSNHVEPSEGSLAALLDANYSTFFHSTWSQETDGSYAWLQADLGCTLDQVGIAYAKRNSSSTGNPTTIHVFASNDPTDVWEDQGYVTCTYEYATTVGRSSVANYSGCVLITMREKYRHIRLQVEATQGGSTSHGNLFFYWSEFRAYDPKQSGGEISTDVKSLQLSEIQTANVDMFLGPTWNYDGWIEFYNPTEETISMRKCYLSDDPANLQKYLIYGNTKIPAKGYGCIWLGKHEDNGVGQVQTKLDMDGGTFYLSDNTGALAMTIDYPAGITRASWTKKVDGTWGFTSKPTPKAVNTTEGYATEMLPAPIIDTPSQLFQGRLSFHVTIPDGCTLHFTTDGSTPTDTSSVSHTGSFSLDNTTGIYRFRLYKDGLLPSPVVTRSYIYTDREYTVPVVSVVTNPDNLYSDSIGVMVKGVNGISGRGQSDPCNWNRDWDRPVNFEYFDSDGDLAFYQEANLIIAGGWSRAYEPHSFKIKANKIYYNLNSLDHPFFTAKPYLKHKSIQFRSGGNDNSCRFMDAGLQTIIQSSGIDIDGLSYQPTVHYLNGKYNGVINLREPNNKHFVYANRGWDEEDIDFFELSNARYNQECGNKTALDSLRELTKLCADSSIYEQVCRMLDIDEFCNYMATEIYLGTTDWLNNNNNCKGYHRRGEDERYRFVMFDLDSSFGTTEAFDFFSKTRSLYNDDTGKTEEYDMVNIFIYLCNSDKFRKKFADTFCLVAGSVFEPSRVEHIVDSLVSNVSTMMSFEGRSPSGSANSIKSHLTRSRQTTMINNMIAYERLQLSATPTQDVSFKTNTTAATLRVNGIPVPTNTFSGTLFSPITLNATVPAGWKFKGWKGQTGTSSINLLALGDTWKYYDQGSLDGIPWQQPTYDDALWQQGPAPLGYSNSGWGFNTIVSYGEDSSNKYPTTYFRTTFDMPTGEIEALTMHFLCDDGFVLYVNGTEATRFNLPEGDITFNTYTPSYSGDYYEKDITLPASLFTPGTNTIAVELHNCSATSSDIYWDASITAQLSDETEASYLSTQETFTLPQGESLQLTACYEKDETEESGDRNLPIRINEISAANGIYANEYYKRNDWIELYNTTSETIDLAGMYFSDDLEDLHKYQIPTYDDVDKPSTLIEPYGYKVLWCDNQTDSLQLHTHFKLSAEGGYVILTEGNDLWTDSLYYSAHSGNQTVGLYPDGGRDCYVLSRPTIAQTNQLTTYSDFLYSHIIPIIPTGIDTISESSQEEDEGWYDLAGRRISEPTTSGIYIHGGKKVWIR